MPSSPLHDPVLTWFDAHSRDLPWRRPGVPAWHVLVSEVMLQQTPVARVLEPWATWVARWPAPADLAAEPAGEAVRAWGRLGYPRRALRLHAAATAISIDHGGQVPGEVALLRTLPGVGAYTAAAVAAFAFGRRVAVVDTNVRRVHARAAAGRAEAAPSLTAAESALAVTLLPDGAARAARWSVAAMELGALVCTARSPSCGRCPVLHLCAWQRAGAPPRTGPTRKGQAWAGTDRQVRGRLLAVLRESELPVAAPALDAVWDDAEQRQRALTSLLGDGLVERCGDRYALPGVFAAEPLRE